MLKGKQKKLDKNKDGKISGADFKMMKRGGKATPKKMKNGGGLYANIAAKKKRIAAGSGEKMRKPGDKALQQKKILKGRLKLQRKNMVEV